jgi:leucyl/phenylalanyl-tRNA---protein transferase
MTRSLSSKTVPWLQPGEAFPPVDSAWGLDDPAPGLLAAGGALDLPTLKAAYARGIFPWYSAGQPILWWSTDPRMVLHTEAFRLHRSLRKTLQGLLRAGRLEIRMDHDFAAVIQACARTPREGQSGTWILPAIAKAYLQLHRAQLAHSVEAWIDGELAGGLYGVNLGSMVFGESMFSRRSNASKIALAALVAFCRAKGLPLIDCQQDTAHLASLGGELMPRAEFCRHLQRALPDPAPTWEFDPVYWQTLFDPGSQPA